LKIKIEDLHNTLAKFIRERDNLNILLGNQKDLLEKLVGIPSKNS
jgi:hypothetical protein